MAPDALKWFELRRHSWRDASGHLSEAGRALAHRTRPFLHEPYARCISSPKTRAIETLTEFGFGVDATDANFGPPPGDRLERYQNEIHRLMEQNRLTLLQAYMSHPETMCILRDWGDHVWKALRLLAESVAPGQRVLIVSHGGTIESMFLTAIGGPFDLQVLGGELRECEGLATALLDDRLVAWEIYRMHPALFEEPRSHT